MSAAGPRGIALARPAALALLLAGLGPVAPAPAAAASTTEAIAVWQQRAPGGEWDVWFGALGRPAVSAPATDLGWWTPSDGEGAPLSAQPGDDESPAVAMQPGGPAALAVWQHRAPSGERDVARAAWDGAGWSASTAFADPGPDYDPAVALDEDGSGLVVWVNGSSGALRWSARTAGSAWSSPASVPGAAGASLPEIAFLDAASQAGAITPHHALVAFAAPFDDPQHGVVARTFVARWDGAQWAAAAPIPLEPDQRALMPTHAGADYAQTPAAFQRLGLAPETGGGAHVYWGGPVGPALGERYDSPTVMGSRLDPATGAWRAVRGPSGSSSLAGTCHSPDVAASGPGGVVAVFGSDGFLEQGRALGETLDGQGDLYRTRYDDARPTVAPLADRVVALASGLAYPWEPEVADTITWSLGTLRPAFGDAPASVTWEEPRTLALPESARFPDVASVTGGTQNPIRASGAGRAYAAGGADATLLDASGTGDGETAEQTPAAGAGPIAATGARVSAWREGGEARSLVTVSRLVLATNPTITVEGLRVEARASCEGGPAARVWGSLRIGDDPPVDLDARQNTQAPAGPFTVRVNQQSIGSHSAAVRALRITGAGADLVVGYAEASVSGCTGSGAPVPPGGGHEH